MIETKFVAKKGLEKFYEIALSEKEQFETELEIAKQIAIEEVESRFAEKKTIINEIFEKVVDIVEVETPDTITEEAEDVLTSPIETVENETIMNY